MTRVSFVQIPSGSEDIYNGAITPSNRFVFSSVRLKPLFTSRKRKKELTLISLTPAAADSWNALSPTVQDEWKTAGLASNYKPFQCFLRDFASRTRNALPVPGTPSDFVQNSCGRMVLSGSATHMRIVQEHPFTYYILRKVTGTKSQYSPVLVTEEFGMPLRISISYKTNLTASGANPSARFYAEVLSTYQGQDKITTVELLFDLVADWNRVTATLDAAIGIVRKYTLFIQMTDVQGTLNFDNPEAYHSGQNWIRDPRCDHVATTYTKSFYQVEKNWVGDDLPTGSYYDSIYYEL